MRVNALDKIRRQFNGDATEPAEVKPKQVSYSEKLKHPMWQKRRLEILTRDNFTCKLCGDTETTLHIHHKEYQKGKDPWDYPDHVLDTLCMHCHRVVEEAKDYGDYIKVVKVLDTCGHSHYIAYLRERDENKQLRVVFIYKDPLGKLDVLLVLRDETINTIIETINSIRTD